MQEKRKNILIYFVLLVVLPMFAYMKASKQQDNILNFKASDHLKEAILKNAQRAGLKPSTYIREVVKKYIRYKEPDLI